MYVCLNECIHAYVNVYVNMRVPLYFLLNSAYNTHLVFYIKNTNLLLL